MPRLAWHLSAASKPPPPSHSAITASAHLCPSSWLPRLPWHPTPRRSICAGSLPDRCLWSLCHQTSLGCPPSESCCDFPVPKLMKSHRSLSLVGRTQPDALAPLASSLPYTPDRLLGRASLQINQPTPLGLSFPRWVNRVRSTGPRRRRDGSAVELSLAPGLLQSTCWCWQDPMGVRAPPRPAPPPLSNKTRSGGSRAQSSSVARSSGLRSPRARCAPRPNPTDGAPGTAAAAEPPAGGRLPARPGLGARVPARETDWQGGGFRARLHTPEFKTREGGELEGSRAGRECTRDDWHLRSPEFGVWAAGRVAGWEPHLACCLRACAGRVCARVSRALSIPWVHN